MDDEIKSSNDDKATTLRSDNDIADKMSEGFPITSICRNDIIQMIEDRKGDDLKDIFLYREARKITDHEMRWLASKLADGFCNCCFWDILEDRFDQIMGEKHGIET